jgi:glycosyltransferase involved in cell wall biosynthesis
MRVAYNACYLNPGVSGGTETILHELVPRVARRGIEPVVVTSRRGAAALHAAGWRDFSLVLAVHADDGQRLRRLAAEQVTVPREARARGCALVHSLANTGPLHAGLPHVMSVHDVHFHTVAAMGRVSSLGHRLVVGPAARRAQLIVAISATARDEIAEVLAIEPSRFAVIPLGAGRGAPVESANTSVVRRRFGLGEGPVVLCVAAKRPHKNQALLLHALPEEATLVLAGHPEAYDAELRALAANLGIAERVRFAGYVPDPELEALWELAGCAALPTLSEGFGLPVLEALRRGVPVACSDLPVLREVGGDVPHYFDPTSAEDARRAISAALTDRSAGERGPARAAGFTWDSAADNTVAAYERVLACTSA